jgi:homoserine kinase
LCAARKLLHSRISDKDLLPLAAEFEGHADNAAACLLGGLVIVMKAQNGWIVEKVPIQPLKAVIVLPEVKLSTQEARAALPASIVRQEAVDNVGRAALLVHALRAGRKDLLKEAMQDHLHQPYRLKLIPGAEAALQAAYDTGAYGAALSGAGPSLIAFGDENLEGIGKAMQGAFSNKGVQSMVYLTASSAAGIEYNPTE